MTDREILPDTDDPYALLGVGEKATEKEIRRAYLRQLKKHSPDRDPVGFQRIREAYEQLTGDEYGAPRPSPPPRRPPGSPDSEDAAVQYDHADPPPSFKPAEPPPSYEEELEAVERALYEDRLEAAVDELLALPLAANRGDDLVSLVLRTACAVVWKDRHLVDRIAERYAAELHDDSAGELGEQARTMMGLALDIEAWRERLGDPDDALLLYLRRGAVAGINESHRLALALCEELVADRTAFYERLEAIGSDTVLEYLRERLARHAARYGWRPWPPSALHGVPYMIVGDLNLMRAHDKKLSLASAIGMIFTVLTIVALVYGLSVHWTLAVAAPIAVVVVAYLILRGTTASAYRRIFVPRLIEHLWNRPVHPYEVAREYERNAPSGHDANVFGADYPDEYPELIRRDDALAAYAEAVNLARVMWNRR